ncbi:hypothetical protein [Micromonospora foliorum]|uniref:hypothetical protein n=1 Tax=Micromonospora foliorum TaxID=2911210 RepID=UPI001EE8F744|nr:hypothetical protein [Micromonospora foliorum]MCG5437630.1 hypothetical protein [Micromonospora foliorum]
MTGRRTGRALLAGGLLLTLLTAGCGVRPSAVIIGRPPISGRAQGTWLYLLAQGELVLVLRPAPTDPSPAAALALLAAGPQENERDQGFTSDVPAGLGPVTVTEGTGQSGDLTVRTDAAAHVLSAHAVDQIICTAVAAAAQVSAANTATTVTVVGPDGARGPRACPMR